HDGRPGLWLDAARYSRAHRARRVGAGRRRGALRAAASAGFGRGDVVMIRNSLIARARSLAMAFTAVVVGILLPAARDSAQPARSDADMQALRGQIERRFNVLQVREGVVLTPRTAVPGIAAIEISDDTVSVDGQPVTGAELRQKLGADADSVLQLSYLDSAARRSMFAPQQGTPPAPPPPPTPPTPESAIRDRVRDRIRDRIEGRARHRGDRLRFGGGVTIEKDEIVDGDVVSLGGPVKVDGQVSG